MTLMQQWQYLNLTRNSFFLTKGIVSCRQTISSRLYVCSNRTCLLAGQALL